MITKECVEKDNKSNLIRTYMYRLFFMKKGQKAMVLWRIKQIYQGTVSYSAKTAM